MTRRRLVGADFIAEEEIGGTESTLAGRGGGGGWRLWRGEKEL
jgi:hypothetical protein